MRWYATSAFIVLQLYFQSSAGILPHQLQRSCICITAVMFYNVALMVNDHAFSYCIRLVISLMAGAF